MNGEPMRHNGMDQDHSPEEIEREVARTRSDLNETLRAIEHRFSREELMDQAIDYLRGGPREFAVNLSEQARDNPLPVVLTTIGLGWLMFSNRHGGYRYEEKSAPGAAAREKASEFGDRSRERYEDLKERGKEGWESTTESAKRVGDAVSEKSEQLREAVGEKFDQARAGMDRARKGLRFRARAMASGMRHGSEETASGIRQSGERTRDSFFYLLREQPLALAALGVALGAGLAAAMPTTRRERETFGPVRDETVNRARETGSEQMEKTRSDLKQAVSEPPPHSGPH